MRNLLTLAALLSAVPAIAEPIPAPVAAMIDAAAADPAQLKTVTDIAKKTNPGSAAEIDARVAEIGKQAAAAHEAKLASEGAFEGWTGQGEAGGSISSGNTTSEGLALGLTFQKESQHWRHKLNGVVDYQRDNHVTSKERYIAEYAGNYRITPRFFALLILGYERDTFAGYTSRFSEGVGLGYQLIETPAFKLDLEGGPALRQTDFITGHHESNVAARAAANMLWQLSPGTALTEAAVGYFASGDTTLSSTTALTAKLMGSLSARASFSVINESHPPAGRKHTDTTTRATLVYSF